MAKTGQGKNKDKGIKLVVVESPTKAKTIRKFLGKDYVVESCMGHVRDLPQSAKDIPEKYKKEEWATLGVNVDKDFEPIYCIPQNKTKVVKLLKDKLADAEELYLATDEDREGESISWHLVEVLKPKVPMKRMVFHEITKDAIEKALKNTRHIDSDLVRAQEARRILDRLVGYTISPLLWKKVAYGLSAGRVQSVAVKLIAQREQERLKFKKAEYWGVTATLNKDGTDFEARLLTVSGQRIATGKDFDGTTGKLADASSLLLLQDKAAHKIANESLSEKWNVSEVEERPVSRKPAPPFITSTLQQEANRKLGLSSRETMQVAQKLYEEGFITYMRTDSTFLSQEAIKAARDCIGKKYGKEYLPEAPRTYGGKKVKGAQEAHEAIRPAGNEFITPDDTGLSGVQFKLYDLIWKRTVASQMLDAKQKQVSAKLAVDGKIFNATGMTIEFPGFLRAYVEGSDDPEADLESREVRLPQLKKGESVKCKKTEPTQHETKPPARFTEASLVQTMEKEGIGRPSTYASIISTVIDRGYVRKQGNTLVPTFTAMVVAKLLENYLSEFVDLKFTSEMEKSLDDIAQGDLDWLKYLASIYSGQKGLKKLIEKQEKNIDPDEARTLKLEGLDKYTFKVGKYGAYLESKRDGEPVSASIPESESPADMTPELAEKLIDQKLKGADALGKDPESGKKVYVLTGRYGPYVQLGESDEEKVKRTSIPAMVEASQISLKQALDLLSMPKKMGLNPLNQKDIKLGIGRFGPYVVSDGDYRSIPKGENIFEFSLEQAIELFKQPKKGRGKAAPLKELGEHPETGDKLQIYNGPYGPYLKAGKKNFSLPEGSTPEKFSLEEALALVGSAPASEKKAKKTKAAPKSEAKAPAKALAKTKAGGAKDTEAVVAKTALKGKVKTRAKGQAQVRG